MCQQYSRNKLHKLHTVDVKNHITKYFSYERYSSDSFQGSRIHRHFITTANGFEKRSFLLIRVHQMSPYKKSKHLLILLTLCHRNIWAIHWNTCQIYEKNGKCFLWSTKDDPSCIPLFNCFGHVESLLVQVNRVIPIQLQL